MCASMHACMWEEDVLVCACMLMHVFKCFEAKVKRLAAASNQSQFTWVVCH